MLLGKAAALFHLRRCISSFTQEDNHDHAAERCRRNGGKHHRLKRVKKGHFTVLAFEEGERRRFLVPLAYLTNPAFLKLLQKAQDEYGFEQHGILTLPCHRSELEDVLHELRHE